jgi:hypothetical protein
MSCVGFLLLINLVAAPVQAQSTPQITVKIGGTTIGPGPAPLNIPAGSYGNVTISNFGGTARVEASAEASGGGTTDMISLKNMTITANSAVSNNVPISFSANGTNNGFWAPPTSGVGSAVWYQATGAGNFTRTGGWPTGDSMTLQGWADPPDNNSWDQFGSDKTCTVGAPPVGNNFSSQTGCKSIKEGYPNGGNPALSNPRGLKGVFSFTLSANDKLNISSITVAQTDPGGDGDDGPECPSLIPESQSERFMCRWFGIFCEPCVVPDK